MIYTAAVLRSNCANV